MNLWVRSQDKENLIPIKNPICVYDNKIIYKESASYIITIGEYKTKERALEVLDEIYKLLIPKPIISTSNAEQAELLDGTVFIKPMLDDIKLESDTSYVYQMPKD